MKQYFYLQYKMINRSFVAFGVPIILGYTLPFLSFVYFSEYLFSKTDFAPYILLLLAITIVAKLSGKDRNEFLKTYFKSYYKLRVLENSIIILPFSVCLLYKGYWEFMPIIMILSLLMAIITVKNIFTYVIPTPFYKYPFEFTEGFRKTYLIFPVAYYITYESINVGNLNLGLFSIILIYLIIMIFYSSPENEYFVWSYKLNAKQFLIKKLRSSIYYSLLLSAPIVLSLGISFYKDIELIMSFFLISLTSLIALILAKYSAYPNKMNISHGVLLISTLLVPPFLIIIVPYFYIKALKSIKFYLHD